MSTDDHKVCVLCHDTGVVWDGGASFQCHCCKRAKLSPVDAMIYATTFALVMDRTLLKAWSNSTVCKSKESMDAAEYEAARYAVETAAAAVTRFHDVADSIHDGWAGTETDRLYTAALTHRR